MESILDSTKKVLGLEPEYTAFDADIIMHINTIFSNLHQMGVGPEEGFQIEDKTKDWSEFLDDDMTLNNVKSFMYLSVRLMFDPPGTSYAIQAMERQVEQLAWRIVARREEKRNG